MHHVPPRELAQNFTGRRLLEVNFDDIATNVFGACRSHDGLPRARDQIVGVAVWVQTRGGRLSTHRHLCLPSTRSWGDRMVDRVRTLCPHDFASMYKFSNNERPLIGGGALEVAWAGALKMHFERSTHWQTHLSV